MHPDDLTDLGVTDGEVVTITSDRSSIEGVVAAADDVKRGVVSMSHAWGGRSDDARRSVRSSGSPTNRLVSADDGYDPITGMAVQSAIPVTVTAPPIG